MRKLLLLASALCMLSLSANPANAKTRLSHGLHANPGNAIECPIKNNSRAFAIVKEQQDAIRAQKQQTERVSSYPSERLIASSTYTSSYADTPSYPVGIYDSANYVYTGQRGSTYDPNYLDFITPSASIFSTATPVNYFFAGTTMQFTSNANVASILADTTLIWNSNATDTAGNYFFSYAEYVHDTYDANNNVLTCADSNDNAQSFEWDSVINTYGSDGNIAVALSLQWSGSAWDSSACIVYTYNSSGQLIHDSSSTYTGTWGPSNKDSYYYTSSGLLSSTNDSVFNAGAWTDQVKVYFDYNSSNQLQLDTVKVYSGGVWMTEEADSFGYTTGADYWTAFTSQITFGSQWETVRESKHVNSSLMPDTLYEKITGSFSTYTNKLAYAQKVGYIYDAYNNPTTSYRYYSTVTDTVTGAWAYDTTADFINHYYYQDFIAAAVTSVNAPMPKVTAFPNPTDDMLNISITDLPGGTYTTLRIVNIVGQTVIAKTLPWTTQTQSLSLSGIAPGIYVLQVQDDKGNTMSTQKIIKQ